MIKNFILFTFIFLFYSCGKQETVPTNFQVMIGGLSAGINVLNDNGEGGMAIWGRNKITNTKFGHVFQAPYPSDINFNLDLGDWEFYGALWEGNNNNTLNEPADRLQGTVRCAFIGSTKISADTRVNLNFSSATCANGAFAPAGLMNTNNFNTLQFVSCSHLHGVTNGAATCVDQPGPKFTYKVVLNDYDTSIGDQPMTLESACFSNTGAPIQLLDLPVNIPVGINQNSPFKTTVLAFAGAGCTNTIDQPQPLRITYVNGHALKPYFFDRADGNPIAYTDANKVVQLLAMNEHGFGWSPLFAQRPFMSCRDSGGSLRDCFGQFNTKTYEGAFETAGGSHAYIDIDIDKVRNQNVPVNLSGAAEQIRYCRLSSFTGWNGANHYYTDGSSWYNLTSPTNVPVILDGTRKICRVKFDIGSGQPNDTSTGESTVYGFNIEFYDFDGAATPISTPAIVPLNQFYLTTPSYTTSTTMNYFYQSENYKKALSLKQYLHIVPGAKRNGEYSEEFCWGRNCPTGQQDDKPENGLFGVAQEIMGPHGYFGALGKLGYKTCSSLQTELSTNGPKTWYGSYFNGEVNANFNWRIELKSSAVARLSNMQNYPGNFNLRLEFWDGPVNSTLIQKANVNVDCSTTQPQMYLEFNHSYFQSGVRDEKRKFKFYIIGQNKATTSSLTYYGKAVKVEEGANENTYMESIGSEFDKSLSGYLRMVDRKMIYKFNYNSSTKTLSQWSLNAEKSSYPDQGINFRHSWRLARVYASADVKASSTTYTRGTFTEMNSDSFNTNFNSHNADYPLDNYCYMTRTTTSPSFTQASNITSIFSNSCGSGSNFSVGGESFISQTLYSFQNGLFSQYPLFYTTQGNFDKLAQYLGLASLSLAVSTSGGSFSTSSGCDYTGSGTITVQIPTLTYNMTDTDQYNDNVYTSAKCTEVAQMYLGNSSTSTTFSSAKTNPKGEETLNGGADFTNECFRFTGASSEKVYFDAQTSTDGCNETANVRSPSSAFDPTVINFDFNGFNITESDFYLDYVGLRNQSCNGSSTKTLFDCDFGF